MQLVWLVLGWSTHFKQQRFAFEPLNLERGEFLMTGRSSGFDTTSRDICVTAHFTRVYPDHGSCVRAGQRPPD